VICWEVGSGRGAATRRAPHGDVSGEPSLTTPDGDTRKH